MPTKTDKELIEEQNEKVLENQDNAISTSNITVSVKDNEVVIGTPMDGTKELLHAAKTVNFLVEYPKDYKGDRHMAHGSLQPVARDAAEQFTKMGIGKIQK